MNDQENTVEKTGKSPFLLRMGRLLRTPAMRKQPLSRPTPSTLHSAVPFVILSLHKPLVLGCHE